MEAFAPDHPAVTAGDPAPAPRRAALQALQAAAIAQAAILASLALAAPPFPGDLTRDHRG